MCHIQCITYYFTSWISFNIFMLFSYIQNKTQLQHSYLFLNVYPFKILQVFYDTKFVYFCQITKNSFCNIILLNNYLIRRKIFTEYTDFQTISNKKQEIKLILVSSWLFSQYQIFFPSSNSRYFSCYKPLRKKNEPPSSVYKKIKVNSEKEEKLFFVSKNHISLTLVSYLRRAWKSFIGGNYFFFSFQRNKSRF